MGLVVLLGSLTVRCSAQPGTMIWHVTIGAGVRIAPAIGPDGTIFATCGDPFASNGPLNIRMLYAISPQGTTNWTFEAGSPIRSAPAVGADGTIYFGAADGLYSVSPEGATNWITPLAGSLCSSPAIGADGTVYIRSRTNRSGPVYPSKLQAISPTGTVNWTCSIGTGNWGVSQQSPSPSVGPDGTIYVCSFSSQLYSISPSGSTNWICLLDPAIYSPYPSYCSPAIGADGTVYVGSDVGKLIAVAANGTQRWAFQTPSTVESTPALDEAGNLYFGATGNGVWCLNAQGVQKWYQNGSGYSASAAIAADGTVYVPGWNAHRLFAYSLDGTYLWSFPFPSQPYSFSSPVIGTNGTIYCGGGDLLYAIQGTAPPMNSAWPMFRRDARQNARSVQRGLEAIGPLPTGGMELLLRGETGRVYSVEASTNFLAWETIASFNFSASTIPFVDTAATNFAQRYYRLSTAP